MSRRLVVECPMCGDGPMLAGELAHEAEAQGPPALARAWLAGHGWSEHDEQGFVCAAHAARVPARSSR